MEFAKRAKQRPRTAAGGSAPHTHSCRQGKARQGERERREGERERERGEEGGRESACGDGGPNPIATCLGLPTRKVGRRSRDETQRARGGTMVASPPIAPLSSLRFVCRAYKVRQRRI